MIRPIMKLEPFLAQPSTEATEADLPIAQDLKDTLAAHSHECVGMAANMIGERKRVIVFDQGGTGRIMINPAITKQAGPYETEEGCLSLVGKRPAKRFKQITVRFQDEAMAWHTERFTGFTAQIIQHELDHLEGIII